MNNRAQPTNGQQYKILTFDELDGGLGAPSIRSARGTLPEVLVAPVVRYLDSGVLFLRDDEECADVFDLDAGPDRDLSLVTDGDWIWRRMVSYYVREYRCGLDERFVEIAMRSIAADKAKVDLREARRWWNNHR